MRGVEDIGQHHFYFTSHNCTHSIAGQINAKTDHNTGVGVEGEYSGGITNFNVGGGHKNDQPDGVGQLGDIGFDSSVVGCGNVG